MTDYYMQRDAYKSVSDGYKSMSIGYEQSDSIVLPSWQSSTLEKPKQLHTSIVPKQFSRHGMTQAYPRANLSHMTNFAYMQSTPDETLDQCEEHLRERNMTNFTRQRGEVVGYFFGSKNDNVKFALRVKERGNEEYVLHALRMHGDAFLFDNFWRYLSADLAEKQLIESEDDEDSEASWDMDMILTSDEEDDMEINLGLNQDQYLKFENDVDTVKVMIDDMKDASFRESCASTLAYNCNDNDNRSVVMAFGPELFEAIILGIVCSLASCYYSQLPFYRSAAMLLDTMFDSQAVQGVSTEQFEALVAATYSWSVNSQHNQGEITNSEEIATILSKQLARCTPQNLSQQTVSYLQEIQQRTTFSGVQNNVRNTLNLVF